LVARVALDTHASLSESLPDAMCLVDDLLLVGFTCARGEANSDNCDLILCNAGRENSTLVVGMYHEL
jgi:hypothetical protein